MFRSRFFPAFENAYIRVGSGEVFKHALRLACGINSQLQAEAQILEQLTSWLNQVLFPRHLKLLWERVLSLAKDIRAYSGLSEASIDMAEVVLKDLSQHLDPEGSGELRPRRTHDGSLSL